MQVDYNSSITTFTQECLKVKNIFIYTFLYTHFIHFFKFKIQTERICKSEHTVSIARENYLLPKKDKKKRLLNS